jgi:hypothetical protein
MDFDDDDDDDDYLIFYLVIIPISAYMDFNTYHLISIISGSY